MVSFMFVCVCVCVCMYFCWFSLYIYNNIYLSYYGQVKKHENVSVISNLVVGKEKPFGFFGGVI